MKIHSRIVAWLLLLAATPATLYAQAARAELTGQVTGADGAASPGAHITVRALRTNDSRVVVSGDNGFYTLPALPPGGYAVTVELTGFKRFVQNRVTLATGERIRLDVSLTVGGLEETVNVTGEPSTLRTESGSLGQVVPNAAIVGLPLNGRNFISLITLAPGVASPPGSAFPRINGGRPRVNEYLFDGVSVLQPEPGQVAFTPVVDAIDEFKIETNSPSAEFGRFNGGVINLTTKSGTNALNGTAFAFTRHESLNARNAFAPSGDKPVFRRNQFGGVVGGPIARDRTFFFADYQGTRQEIGRVASPRFRRCSSARASSRSRSAAACRRSSIPQRPVRRRTARPATSAISSRTTRFPRIGSTRQPARSSIATRCRPPSPPPTTTPASATKPPIRISSTRGSTTASPLPIEPSRASHTPAICPCP